MRKIYLIILLYMLLITNVWVVTVGATTIGMETTAISAEEQASIIDNIDLHVIQDDSQKAGVQCFDVDHTGAVALGVGSGDNCMIYVYDADGTFQYGFCFYCDGDYGIVFQGDKLSILLLRGNVLATYDSDGTCLQIEKIAEVKQNYEIMKELLNQTEKDVSGKHYSLERDMAIGDFYSRLVVTDERSERTILYDATKQNSLGQIVLVVFIVCFFLMVIQGCVRKSMRDKRCT